MHGIRKTNFNGRNFVNYFFGRGGFLIVFFFLKVIVFGKHHTHCSVNDTTEVYFQMHW